MCREHIVFRPKLFDLLPTPSNTHADPNASNPHSIPSLQILLLPPCPRILIQMPLPIPVLALHRPTPYLKQPHRHARPHLRQLHALPPRLDKHMVPHLNTILPVHERHHAVAQLLARRRRGHRLARWEQVLEDLHHPLAQWGREVLEDQVRVRFADGAACGGGQVVPQQHVMQRERGRGAVREVRDRQRGGGAAVLVQDEQVRQAGGVGGRDEVGQHQVAPVQPDGGREEEADLLGEGGEARGGGAGRGDEDARVDDAGEVGVLVVDAEGRLLRGGVRLGFIVLEVGAEGGVVGNGGVERLARCEGCFEGGALGGDFGVAEGEGAAVEVVAPLAGLSADHAEGMGLFLSRCTLCRIAMGGGFFSWRLLWGFAVGGGELWRASRAAWTN